MRLLVVFLVASVALASCGSDRSADDQTGAGPHASELAVRIVYPPESQDLNIPFSDFSSAWDRSAATIEGAAPLVLNGAEAEAVDPSSGIKLDAVVGDGRLRVAQLTVVDAAGDEDEAAVVASVLAFLEALQVDGVAVLEALDLTGATPLFEERTATVVDEGVTLYLASNEDTILLGATRLP